MKLKAKLNFWMCHLIKRYKDYKAYRVEYRTICRIIQRAMLRGANEARVHHAPCTSDRVLNKLKKDGYQVFEKDRLLVVSWKNF